MFRAFPENEELISLWALRFSIVVILCVGETDSARSFRGSDTWRALPHQVECNNFEKLTCGVFSFELIQSSKA